LRFYIKNFDIGKLEIWFWKW